MAMHKKKKGMKRGGVTRRRSGGSIKRANGGANMMKKKGYARGGVKKMRRGGASRSR